MTEFRARIGRVRMKSGGADVRILERKAVNPEGEDWRGTIVNGAKNVAQYATDDNPLAGYIVLGIFKDGSSSLGWRYDAESAKVPRALLPHWVAELIRRDIITYGEAKDVFDSMFEWVER
jgi:hypothetical protein